MNDDDVDPGTRDDDASLDEYDPNQAEVERDDELLSALGNGDRPAGDDALLALMAEWRAEVDSAPLPELPSDEEIEVALAPNVARLWPRRGWAKSHEHHHGQRPALWQAVTGAAAVAAVIVGGLSVAAHSAMPGDPLWDVSKTIFSDRAGEVELVSDLTEHLAAADLAAREGDRDTAERLLAEVTDRLDEVSDAAERVELMKRRDAIKRDLSRVTPSAVPSPAPAPAPAPAPGPGAATLVPGIPVPLPSNLIPPPPPGMPVIPLPLDALRISTTLQIPIDTKRIQDFLAPTTGRPQPGNESLQTPDPTRTTVTQVPTSTTTTPTSPSPAGQPAPPTN